MTKWSGVRLWAVLLVTGLAMAAGVTPAGADTGCSTSVQTLASLASFFAEAGGNGCVQAPDGTQFSDFSFSTAGNTSLFDATAITVTPLTLNGNAGIQVQGGITTTTNMDLNIQFEVSGAGPYTDAHLQLLAGAGDPGSSGTIAETVRGGGTETPVNCTTTVHCLPGVYDVDGPVVGGLFVSIAGSHTDSITFAPQSELVISKDIHVACPTGGTECTVSISDFNQAFSATTPEPATLLLLGSGLAGAGIFGRRRLKKARA